MKSAYLRTKRCDSQALQPPRRGTIVPGRIARIVWASHGVSSDGPDVAAFAVKHVYRAGLPRLYPCAGRVVAPDAQSEYVSVYYRIGAFSIDGT
jgi:hypothetical protein